MRTTVCTDLVYIESGMGSASANIKRRQVKFLKKLMARSDYNQSYLSHLITKAVEVQSPMGVYIQKLQRIEGDPVRNELELLRRKIRNNVDSSRRSTYKLLNPDLFAPQIYIGQSSIPEHQRIAYTRIRLLSFPEPGTY